MFERASVIIRDGFIFDYAYVPSNLVHRESQLLALERLFRPLAESGRACTAFLFGSVGTGKTVTALRFFTDMFEHLSKAGRPGDVIYINCRNISETGVLLQIVRHFDRGYPDLGFSPDEIARSMASHFTSSDRGTVVILDEVNVLLRKGSGDIIYQLTRSDPNRRSPVSLVLISQEPIEPLLDEASISTFCRSNTVVFDHYFRWELREIAQARADEVLYPGRITSKAIDLIAEHASEYGDARVAIELLDRAANIAEEDYRGEVGIEHVRVAKAMIYSTVTESRLRVLDPGRMAVLLSAARSIKDRPSIPSSTVEKNYAVVCEEFGIQVRKHTQYWIYLQDLDRQGLLSIAKVTDSTGMYTAVSLPDIPSKVLAQMMESIIEDTMGSKGDPT